MKRNVKKQSDNLEPKDYAQTLKDLKTRVQDAQLRAVIAANKELLELYWDIGRTITERQDRNGWGTGTVEKLAKDLQNLFPGIAGFSRANIFRMRAFYAAYEKVAQAARQLTDLPIFKIPWFHNVLIIQQIKNDDERLWYAQKTIENGWSRNALEANIKRNLYKREGKAITNFSQLLPNLQSMAAQETLKDPYIFDFLTLADDHNELDIERGLISNVQRMLLEMGKGFAFIGRQYHLNVGESDFYIDLLFYHVKLRCYIVVELKARKFEPRDVGQLNFYLSAVDDMLRHPDDQPTIGLLLCKTKDNIVAEYALRNLNKPIGIAGYETELVEKLPKELKSSLPTVKEIEEELEKIEVISVVDQK